MFTVMPIGLGKGVLGGDVASHLEMGQIAGTLTLQLMAGTPCSELPWVYESPRNYVFDELVMERFNIKWNDIPVDSTILNHTETLWERNRTIIYISLVVCALFVLFIILLVADNLHRRNRHNLMAKANEKLTRTAHYDTLTGIRNRAVFTEDISALIHTNTPFYLFLFDLDNFKQINDVHGHNTGDSVLLETAQRVESLSDQRFTPYRLAGDEFTATLITDRRTVAEEYARLLLSKLQQPYSIGEEPYSLYSSIGVAAFPTDGTDLISLSEAADAAMYDVKRNGKNSYMFYEDTHSPSGD